MVNTSKKMIVFFLVMLVTLPGFMVGTNGTEKDRLSDKTVKVARFGITFKKPNKWFTQNEEEMVRNINKLDENKEDISTMLATHRGSIHVASFTKHDRSKFRGIIPSINVLIRKYPQKAYPDFLGFFKMSQRDISKYLNNFKLTKDITEVTISGKKAGYFSGEFDLNTRDGATHHIKNITYGIPLGEVFIQVSMSEEIPAKNSKLFFDFVNSFVIK